MPNDQEIVFDEDNPEWTEADFARSKPASEILPPEMAALLVRPRGRPPLSPKGRKQKVNIRLSPDVVAALRASGRGWQTRADDILRAALKLP